MSKRFWIERNSGEDTEFYTLFEDDDLNKVLNYWDNIAVHISLTNRMSILLAHKIEAEDDGNPILMERYGK